MNPTVRLLAVLAAAAAITLVSGAGCRVIFYGKDLCACYSGHCKDGKGCLVKHCNEDSCKSPRICFCQEIFDNQTAPTGTSKCKWHKDPCDDCTAPTDDEDPTTPREVLRWEYEHLEREELMEYLIEAGLPTNGTYEVLVERMVDYAIEVERQSLAVPVA